MKTDNTPKRNEVREYLPDETEQVIDAVLRTLKAELKQNRLGSWSIDGGSITFVRLDGTEWFGIPSQMLEGEIDVGSESFEWIALLSAALWIEGKLLVKYEVEVCL